MKAYNLYFIVCYMKKKKLQDTNYYSSKLQNASPI